MATIIVAVWIATFGRATVDPSFQPPEGLSGVALAAATYLFGSGLIKKKDDFDDE